MIILDRREKGMEAELRQHDIEVRVAHLDYADCRFDGRGELNGKPCEVLVGCERKKLSDLVNSMRDRRLAGHQLKGMWREHDFVFLFAEGIWQLGAGGTIEYWAGRKFKTLYTGRQAVSYKQLTAFLTTLELRGGVVVRRTKNARETAAQWAALYHWFNDKGWKDHKSHDQIYAPGPESRRGRRGSIVRKDPATCWRWAAQLDGIDEKAEQVAKAFGSARKMANAKVEDWLEIPGIGKKIAEDSVKAIREERLFL